MQDKIWDHDDNEGKVKVAIRVGHKGNHHTEGLSSKIRLFFLLQSIKTVITKHHLISKLPQQKSEIVAKFNPT